MPEFLEKRFNKYVRWILSVVSLVAYVFTKISVTVYAGALVFQTILPDININLFGYTWGSFWIGAFVTVIVTGVYTILGGFVDLIYRLYSGIIINHWFVEYNVDRIRCIRWVE